MPNDLTIFAAQYLVYLDALAAAIVVAVGLFRGPRPALLRWVVAAAVILVLSLIFAQIGGDVYNDPRPFTVDHVPPLIKHAADNGFPSDHALLAAAIIALVSLVRVWWSIPFVVLAVFVDWARVGAGLHHVVDVLGSSGCVALATLVAIVVTPLGVRFLSRYVPWSRSEEVAAG